MRKGAKKYLLGSLIPVLFAAPALAGELTWGGYVKLDALWTNKMVDSGYGPTGVPINEPDRDHSTLLLDAKESRLNITGTEEVDGVKLMGFIEGDFWGSSVFRLRHAYGKASLANGLSVIAGQTWSNFIPAAVATPETIDFNGAAAQLFGRPAQLRLTYDLAAPAISASASVESHGSDQNVPLVTARAVWAPAPVTVELTGAVTQNRATSGDEERKNTAWGASASAQVALGPVTAYGHLQTLNGLTGLVGNGDFPDTGVSLDDEDNPIFDSIENIRSWGWETGLTCTLGTTTFNLLYGWTRTMADSEDLLGSDSTSKMQTFHINVLQPFWKKMRVGLEYQFAKRELFSHDSGNFSRVQAALWYNF